MDSRYLSPETKFAETERKQGAAEHYASIFRHPYGVHLSTHAYQGLRSYELHTLPKVLRPVGAYSTDGLIPNSHISYSVFLLEKFASF